MKIAGLILAGGQGQRMGGLDKGLQLLDGKPLVQHVIERISPQTTGLWLSANRNIDDYKSLGYPVFSDESILQDMGPLAGICSLMQHLPPEFTHIQITPCDTPFLPIDLCDRLKQEIKTRNFATSTYPKTGQENQYACALVAREHLNLARRLLKQQQYSLKTWLTHVDALPVTNFIDADFININTYTQLASAQTHSPKVNHA